MQNPGQEKLQAFVIGGSSGIGKAISLKFAEIGFDLLIHGGRNAESLENCCKTARSFGAQATGMLHDFTSITDFIAATPDFFNPDILVVAFGPIFEGSLQDSSAETWQRMVSSNLGLPGALISRYAPLMAEKGYGRIILFGGTNTDQIRGFKELAAYSAAKTGLGVLAKSTAREFGPYNVTCNVICPGYVRTENYTPEMEAKGERRMPKHLLQTTENMVNMVISIIRDSENGLNGAILSCAHGM